jgi:hypothetical protein
MSDPVLPGDLQRYAQECLDAWRRGDPVPVDLLADPDARDHLYALPDSYRNDDWTYSDIEGASGSTYLTFRNTEGERIVFRFLNPGIDNPRTGTDPLAQPRIRDVIWNP